MSITIRNQTDLDNALRDHPTEVLIVEGNPELKLGGSSSPTIRTWGSSSPTIETGGSSSPTIQTWDSSSPTIRTGGSSSPTIETWGSSSPTIETWDSSSPTITVAATTNTTHRRPPGSTYTIPGAVLLPRETLPADVARASDPEPRKTITLHVVDMRNEDDGEAQCLACPWSCAHETRDEARAAMRAHNDTLQLIQEAGR